MKFIKNILCICFLSCFAVKSTAQFITVDDTYSAQQLVENVLINSPCANVSNFSVIGDPFSSGQQSFGYFNSGSSGFPFSEGIVLSTSRAKKTEGPNNNLIDEGSPLWLGDSELEQALNITNTYNATLLEFDFTPLTSYISFDYIFASEEYQGTAPCRYSDGFAFLLKEAGSSNQYRNLALIPNTNTPVLVTSVHPAISDPGGCPAINERYFGSYNGASSPINFNGQTVVMTAEANVVPGTTYHIKLVIADHENIRYDSAIFLGGGTFNVGTDLGPDQLISTNNPVCQGTSYPLDATEPGTNNYRWFKDNNPIIGANSPIYNVTTSGVYKVEITLGTSACVATGEVTIEYVPKPALTNTTIVQCDEDSDGYGLFNLTKADTIIRNNDPILGNVTYYEFLADAQNQDTAQAITNIANYESLPKTIYAGVGNNYGCYAVATVSLQLSNNPVPLFRDFETCDLDADIDGFFAFNLRDADPIVLNGLPAGLVVEYYPTIEDAILQTNILPLSYTNTIQYQMYIYAKILNGPDCYGIIPLHLFVNSHSPDNFEDETVILCDLNTVRLEVDNIFGSYSWSNGGMSNYTDVSTPGEYTVTVSDSNTCLATKKFIVVPSDTPVIVQVEINDLEETDNTILIHYTGSGNYEFSVDGIIFQDSPYFTGISAGEHTAWVRDKNGCGEAVETFYVLNYPKYFTPNADGYNDIWNIPNVTRLSGATIAIFDRYGKLLYKFTPKQKGWDGKYNSKDLPSEDYWFAIHMENGKTVKGHFALKR